MAINPRIRRLRLPALPRGYRGLGYRSAQIPKTVSMATAPDRVRIANGKNHSAWESQQDVRRDSQREAVSWTEWLLKGGPRSGIQNHTVNSLLHFS